MGAGIIIVPLAILSYMPFLIWAIFFYKKTNKVYKKECESLTAHTRFKWSILFIYVIAFLTNENFGQIIMHTIEPSNHEWHRLAYWFKHDIKRMLLGWDDFADILYYWTSTIIAYVIAYVFSFAVEKFKNIRLYIYNRNLLATFLLVVQPFIILSIIGRLLRWETMVNKWLDI